MPQRVAAATACRITPQEAAGFVSSGMWLDYGGGLCQPDVFDQALAERKNDLHGVKIRACLTMRPRAVLEADPEGEHFFWVNLHFSGYDRRQHDAGLANYLPVNLGEIPDYYRRFIDPVDIVVLKTCPMDENGFFNFSAATFWHSAVIERARMVIVEESAGLPYAMGEGTGVHTEMLTDGIIDLYHDGRISGARKQLNPGKIVCTFALGSRALYDAIDHNPDLHFCPVDYTNLPHNIMQNDRVVAINNTTQIDLQGQAASESAGHRHISGTGGQLQFVRGAYASKDGKSFICLASTYERHGERRSRIVLNLTRGNIANHEAFAHQGKIITSKEVEALVKPRRERRAT